MMGIGLTEMLKVDLLSDAAARPNVARWFNEISSRPVVGEVKKAWMEYMGQVA